MIEYIFNHNCCQEEKNSRPVAGFSGSARPGCSVIEPGTYGRMVLDGVGLKGGVAHKKLALGLLFYSLIFLP